MEYDTFRDHLNISKKNKENMNKINQKIKKINQIQARINRKTKKLQNQPRKSKASSKVKKQTGISLAKEEKFQNPPSTSREKGRRTSYKYFQSWKV
jgi:hypothetical protein